MHLTPCVFCGSDAELWTEEDGNHMITDAWVECSRCHAKGPMADTEIDAAAKWNVPGVYIRMLRSGSVSDSSPVWTEQDLAEAKAEAKELSDYFDTPERRAAVADTRPDRKCK